MSAWLFNLYTNLSLIEKRLVVATEFSVTGSELVVEDLFAVWNVSCIKYGEGEI